jgi:hypothetical protein
MLLGDGIGRIERDEVALQVVVEDAEEAPAAVGAQDLDLEQVAREDRLARVVGIRCGPGALRAGLRPARGRPVAATRAPAKDTGCPKRI